MQLGLDTCLGTGIEEARLFSTEAEVSVSSVLRLQEVRRPQPIAVNTSKAINPDKTRKDRCYVITKTFTYQTREVK